MAVVGIRPCANHARSSTLTTRPTGLPEQLRMNSKHILEPATTPALAAIRAQASNPSIERTFQRPLRALWPAAHVER